MAPPDEVAQKYRDAMGPELGALFHRLWNECAWLHAKWNEYVALFGTEQERVEILNSTAGSFFRVVQDSLWKDVLLHICRLTDPPKSAGKDNLTLQRLTGLVAPAISQEVERRVKEALRRREFARDWRNRHIAHIDLALALGQHAIPLAAAGKRSVNEALVSIVSVLDAVERHYADATSAYGMAPLVGNAEALLYVLRAGLEAERRKREL